MGCGLTTKWEQIGKTVLGSNQQAINVDLLKLKRYLWVLIDVKTSGSTDIGIRFNGDTGVQYATRFSANNAADTVTLVSQDNDVLDAVATNGLSQFSMLYIISKQNVAKYYACDSVSSSTSAATAPSKSDTYGGWYQITEPIRSIQIFTDTVALLLLSGSTVVVFGADDLGVVDFHESSIYEIFNAITVQAKQRFVDWMSGSNLSSIWTKTNVAGAGTFASMDAVDDGYSISSGVLLNNESQINFNNMRQIIHDSSVYIALLKAVTNSLSVQYGGLSTDQLTLTGVGDKALYCVDTNNANTSLRTADGSTNSETTTDVGIDTSYHNAKISCESSNILLYQDGVLKVTKSSNRPAVKLQPVVGVMNRVALAKEVRCKYLEIYNI